MVASDSDCAVNSSSSNFGEQLWKKPGWPVVRAKAFLRLYNITTATMTRMTNATRRTDTKMAVDPLEGLLVSCWGVASPIGRSMQMPVLFLRVWHLSSHTAAPVSGWHLFVHSLYWLQPVYLAQVLFGKYPLQSSVGFFFRYFFGSLESKLSMNISIARKKNFSKSSLALRSRRELSSRKQTSLAGLFGCMLRRHE